MARKVYYTIPAAYQVPLDNSDHLPMFFSPGTMSKGLAYRCDFVLNKLSAPETDFTRPSMPEHFRVFKIPRGDHP